MSLEITGPDRGAGPHVRPGPQDDPPLCLRRHLEALQAPGPPATLADEPCGLPPGACSEGRLRARGYEGSYDTVKLFVRPLRAARLAAERALVRFDTPPQQSQID